VIFTLTIVPPGEAAAMKSSGLELLEKLQPWLNDQKHPNFLSQADATVVQTQKAYARPVYERLRGIKAEYDPGNTFRFNHNIPPRRQH
jgi:FAD/FMN-containing dehydrogenase